MWADLNGLKYHMGLILNGLRSMQFLHSVSCLRVSKHGHLYGFLMKQLQMKYAHFGTLTDWPLRFSRILSLNEGEVAGNKNYKEVP